MDLYILKHVVENEEKRLFIVHGICEHASRYEPFISFLNENKISVITYDLRGHGRSSGKKGFIRSYKTHVKDLDDVIKSHYNPHVKNFLFGHSMGGLIAHLYLTENKLLAGSIISGAPTDFLNDVKPLRFIGYRWLGFLKKKNDFANDSLSHDQKIEQDYNSDPLVLKKFTLRLAGEMFVGGVRYLKKNYHQNTKPTLILHGKEDKIVPSKFSEQIFKKLNQEDKKLIIYPKFYHEILNEVGKEKVYGDILEWLNEQ